jgi:hypothetical protein
VPTALLGFYPPELSPTRKVSSTFPPTMNPPAVALAVAPSDESSGRTGKTRLPGFDPPESPLLPPVRLTPAAAGCSPGLLSFPGHSTERLVRTPVRTPLTRLAARSSAYSRNRPRLRVSLDARPARPACQDKPDSEDGQPS